MKNSHMILITTGMTVILLICIMTDIYALSPSSMTIEDKPYMEDFLSISYKMQAWLQNHEDIQNDETVWVKSINRMSDDLIQYHQEIFLSAFKPYKMVSCDYLTDQKKIREVYHGTSLLNYLFLKYLGLMDINTYSYIVEEILNLDFDMGVDPGLFFSVNRSRAKAYAMELTQNYHTILKNTEVLGQKLRPGLAFVMLLDRCGVNLNASSIQSLLTTPVLLRVNLQKAYPDIHSNIFIYREGIDASPEVITVFPPVQWDHVVIDSLISDNVKEHDSQKAV